MFVFVYEHWNTNTKHISLQLDIWSACKRDFWLANGQDAIQLIGLLCFSISISIIIARRQSDKSLLVWKSSNMNNAIKQHEQRHRPRRQTQSARASQLLQATTTTIAANLLKCRPKIRDVFSISICLITIANQTMLVRLQLADDVNAVDCAYY